MKTRTIATISTFLLLILSACDSADENPGIEEGATGMMSAAEAQRSAVNQQPVTVFDFTSKDAESDAPDLFGPPICTTCGANPTTSISYSRAPSIDRITFTSRGQADVPYHSMQVNGRTSIGPENKGYVWYNLPLNPIGFPRERWTQCDKLMQEFLCRYLSDGGCDRDQFYNSTAWMQHEDRSAQRSNTTSVEYTIGLEKAPYACHIVRQQSTFDLERTTTPSGDDLQQTKTRIYYWPSTTFVADCSKSCQMVNTPWDQCISACNSVNAGGRSYVPE